MRVSRLLALIQLLLLPTSLSAAGIDEQYVRPSSMPSWAAPLRQIFTSDTFGRSFALVIGVGDYDKYSNLSAPAADAIRVRDFLRDEAGFDYIITLTNEKATRSRIENLMERGFPDQIRSNDRFLFYFSGHGETRTLADQKKRGYLVLKTSGRKTWDEMIDMPRVHQWAQNVGHARHTLLLIDACFSGLAALQAKSDHRDTTIERLIQPAHHLMTAGIEDEESYTFNDASLFTSAFLEAARGVADSTGEGVVSVSEIATYINWQLDKNKSVHSTLKMSPQKYFTRTENNAGEFFFIRKNAALTAKAPGRSAQDANTSPTPESKGPSDRVPNRVPITRDTPLFDPHSGKPLLWFWRRGDADYEFFDASGFHPRSGERLKQFTRDEVKIYEIEITRTERAIKEQQEKLERERKDREARDRAAKEELARKQEEERRTREEQATRASEAGRMCDSLAANPNDRNKVGEGVAFGVLKGQATEAIRSCELAMKQNPEQPRFKYQLARALQWTDRTRAFQLHQELTARRYPASFDNLGWMFYMDRKDPNQAVAQFRAGTQLNDADAMVSLAEMVDRGHVVPSSPAETKIELCRRAADLGHSGAALCYQMESAKEEQAAKDRAAQLQQQQMMLQLMGTVIQSATARRR
jgi:hypothetical protein